MRNVTAAFKNAIVGSIDSAINNARKIYAIVKFYLVDLDATADAVAQSVSTRSFSDIAYATDGIDGVYANYASFELDRWLLTGSFVLQPDTTPEYVNMGWWSGVSAGFSDAITKEFTSPIEIIWDFTGDITTQGLTIFFDQTNFECAEDFDIIFTDSADAEIITVNVTGNTSSVYVYEDLVEDYRHVEVDIIKWSKPNRMARISEVYFGSVITFDNDGDKLMELEILEEIDVVSSVIPYNTVKFTIDNTDKAYNVMNPTGVYAYLEENQKIVTQIGVDVGGSVEYANTGTFYLDKWNTEDSSRTAIFKGSDRLKLLNDTKYYKGVTGTITLYNLAKAVLEDFGLTETIDFVIDPMLDDTLTAITTNKQLPVCKYREALQYIAIAGMCAFYVDRDNIIQIKRLTDVNTAIDIDFDNMYVSPKIELRDVIRSIQAEQYSNEEEATAATTVFEGDIINIGTQDITILYSEPATVVIGDCSITGGGANTVNSGTFYSNMAIINVTTDSTQTLTVLGKKITEHSEIVETVALPAVTTGRDIEVKSPLIDSYKVASDVGVWVLTEIRKRNKLIIDWRMNPALEIGDIVDVENEFLLADDSYLIKDARIIKQTFNYNGALSGTTDTIS